MSASAPKTGDWRPETALCRHFGPCGGCTSQHIDYVEQLRLKTELVTRLVREAVPGAPSARPTLPGAPIDSPWHYRQKVHFVFGNSPDSRGRGRQATHLVIGHYARASRRVIPVNECPVHAEAGNVLAFRLRDACARAGIAAARAGALKSLVVRVGYGTPEVMATLVVTDDHDKRVRSVVRRILDEPGAPTSFHVNVHPQDDGFIFGRETRRIAGPERLREQVAGVSFLISPTAFFQTNVRAAELLVQLVTSAVASGARVLDLYAGAGLFALPLAGAGHGVLAIEESRAAVADGEASLRLNRISPAQCRFIARPVEQALTRAVAGTRWDHVVLDPPREGCSPFVIDRIFADIAPDRAVYVSCNPEALARDLAAISSRGYRIESIQPVDMFPHTDHIESVVVLTRN